MRKYAAKKWQAKIVSSAKCIVSNNNKSNCQAGLGLAWGARRLFWVSGLASAWYDLAWLGLAQLGVATTSCTCFQLNNVAFIFTGCATTTTTAATRVAR